MYLATNLYSWSVMQSNSYGISCSLRPFAHAWSGIFGFFCHNEFLYHMHISSPIVYTLCVSDILFLHLVTHYWHFSHFFTRHWLLWCHSVAVRQIFCTMSLFISYSPILKGLTILWNKIQWQQVHRNWGIFWKDFK